MGKEVDTGSMSELANKGAMLMARIFSECLKVENTDSFAASTRMKEHVSEMQVIVETIRLKNKEYRRKVNERKKMRMKHGSDTSLNDFNK